MGYSTADLITDIKSRGTIPTSQNNWTVPKLLSLATDVMRLHIVPLMSSVREEYFVTYSDTALDGVTTEFDIHRRAVGMGLRDVEWVDGSGQICSVPRLSEEQKQGSGSGQMMFYLRWNKIILVNPKANGYLRQSFMIRPGDLCETTSANVISSVDTSTNTIVVAEASITDAVLASQKLDFIAGEGGHEYVGIDHTISGISGGHITFHSLPSGLAAGDWLAPQFLSPVPQLPDDLMPALAQRCVVQINESGGYWDQRKASMETYQEIIEGMFKLISPRVKGEAKKIVAFAGRGSW
jgi:hypothetical protein